MSDWADRHCDELVKPMRGFLTSEQGTIVLVGMQIVRAIIVAADRISEALEHAGRNGDGGMRP